MRTLNIFCDESGTMPVDDTNDIFLAASIGIIDAYPNFQDKCGHKNWLIERLNEYNAIPFIVYVNPQNGYSQNLKRKFDKVNVMARYTRLITGDNKHFLDENGIHVRNSIWSLCMLHSIGNVILNTIATHEINGIRLYIDQKSFSQPSRLFFINRLFAQLNLMVGSLTKLKNVKADYSITKFKNELTFVSELLLKQIEIIGGKVELFWSEEPQVEIAKSGLHLAHYLGYHFRKDFSNKNEFSISNIMMKNNYQRFKVDITDLILMQIKKESIDVWKRKTGLPQPT